MVVRRFREHISDHNWFAVAVDVGIVVLGVFLGTQVNNWNAGRIEASQAEHHRRRLLQELDFNVRQYVAQVAYYDQVLRHGERAMAALDDESADPGRFVVDAFQLTQIDQAPAKSYIYEELVSGGSVAALGDERLQNLASDYYLNVKITNDLMGLIFPYRHLVRGQVPFSLQQRIGARCGDRVVLHDGRLVGIALPATCTIALDPGEAAKVAAAIRGTPDIRRHLTRYIASVSEKRGTLDFNLGETQTLIRALSHSDRQQS